MAQKKPKKVSKNNFKPEAVYVAKKPVARPPTKSKKVVEKHRKPFLLKRLKRHQFYVIIFLVATVMTVVVWAYVAAQTKRASDILDAAQQITKNSALTSYSQLNVARAVGSDDKLKSEIINLQSAPQDLQEFVLTDYRLFKQKCVVNGQLVNSASYKISNVVYDSFALVIRECNGSDRAIIKKFDSGWGVVFSGNVNPPCALTNDLSIPQGISLYCDQNTITYVNANP